MNRIIENKKLSGEISAITSKSYAHRAIFCAALAGGESVIEIHDLSKDIEASLNAVKGLDVDVKKIGNKFYFNPAEKFEGPVTLDVNESGSTLRFLLPVIATLGLDAKVIRRGSLIGRTNSVYFEEFPKHGVHIREEGDSIYLSGKLKDFSFTLPGNISSQFISGLMLASGYCQEDFNIRLTNETESKPYIDMTIDVMKNFGVDVIENENFYTCKGKFSPVNYVVEKDWSNALFFLVAGVKVLGLNKNSVQGDKKALEFLKDLGYYNISKEDFHLKKINDAKKKVTLDAKNMPDAVPILSIVAAHSNTETEVINIKRLRLKESDRVKSTIDMLENLGVKVKLFEDSFSFKGVKNFKSAKVNTYNDHRIAMAASIAATFADGPITINDSQCVEKSYKNFFCDFKSLGGKTNVI